MDRRLIPYHDYKIIQINVELLTHDYGLSALEDHCFLFNIITIKLICICCKDPNFYTALEIFKK